VVYLIDRSVSMGPSGALETARKELLASLRHLPPATRFQVILYNRRAQPLVIDRRTDLLMASPETVEAVARIMADLQPSGGTDHAQALRAGLVLRPDVLYLVTDADELGLAEVLAVTRFNQERSRSIIHVVELNASRQHFSDSPLAQLATANGGTFRRVGPGR
jgi:hypothetical protein